MKHGENLQACDTRMNLQRRRVSIASTTVVGTTGLAALSFPFVISWWPSVRAHLDGTPVVTVDDSKLQPGQQITVAWRGRPVWVLLHAPEVPAPTNLVIPPYHSLWDTLNEVGADSDQT